MRKGLIFVAVIILTAGCTESQDPVPTEPTPAAEVAVSSKAKAESVAIDPWTVIDAFEVGRDVYVRSLALDASANSLWVGTSVGVHEVDLKTQQLRNTFTRADGLANEYVFSVLVDNDGYKWFGTNGGGVARYRDDAWKVFFPMHGLADYWVYSFGQQTNGDVWIGTWAGANRWASDEEPLTTYFDELINEWVYGIAVDSKDRVWLGTEGGVSMFDGKTWQSWTHKEGLGAANEDNLPISLNTGLGTRSRHDLSVMTDGQSTYNPNYVFSIHVDANDKVWVGTWGGGVSYFDGSRWQNYTAKDGLAGNVVYSIAEADDGALWFGTDHGVSRFDGKTKTWNSYDRRDGLLSDHIYAIAPLPNKEVWLGSRGGVTRLGLNVVESEAGKVQ